MSIANSEYFFPKKSLVKIEDFQDGSALKNSDYDLIFNKINSKNIEQFNRRRASLNQETPNLDTINDSTSVLPSNTILSTNTESPSNTLDNYQKVGTYQTFTNTPACKGVTFNSLNDAIDACNKCNACDGISKIGDENNSTGSFSYILGQRPVNQITMLLKPTNEGTGLQLPPIILPGATTDITKKIYPKCQFRCTPQELSFEFNDKRKQFFGLDAITPNIETELLKMEYTDGIFAPPTQGGTKWEADETYTRLPVNLNKCTISYPIDNKNEWKMDAYLDPNTNCELRVLAQNPENVYNNQKIDLTQAYGGQDSMFGPVAFSSTS